MSKEHKLPFRITISQVKSGRYKAGSKPLSWDDRVSGLDVVLDSEGNEIILDCQGDQSTPNIGWELLLKDKTDRGYSWTLYGVQKV